MKVYVVTTGMYESLSVSGVYASPDAAMAAHPPTRIVPALPTSYHSMFDRSRPGGWQCDEDEDGIWNNGLDWGEYAEICEYEVEGLAPTPTGEARV